LREIFPILSPAAILCSLRSLAAIRFFEFIIEVMMTSTQIRQSFLDFFKSKKHTIVRSSPLDYKSRDGARIFTNAGMNQFVPIFLGEQKPDVDTWGDTIAKGLPTRAADTQKCIRATGKHNDLDDVGLDTYHHTFFEMLGNWSFGDYFKKEAIEWAWELITSKKWYGFPPERLDATVFCPHMDMARWNEELKDAVAFAQVRIKGGTAEYGQEVIGGAKGGLAINYSDDEAASFWAEHFLRAGLDPFTHIVPGNRKDNFWMMGETGPCGPCSELHVDLTPAGKTKGSLVNKGDARCIEIWNLVFIQFNANPDGTFSPLPAKHVDTGMGFERVTSIIQCTKGLKDFAKAKISNYETDIFRPIFDVLEKLSGKKYSSTLPNVGQASRLPTEHAGASFGLAPLGGAGETPALLSANAEQIQIDIAFRVIADHIRTLSFAIADGIQPGNNDRNYVLRRILRRAVRYGRTLGFHEPFFHKLVDVVADTMGDVFPEVRAKKKHVQEVIRTEEEAFNKTLDAGIKLFGEIVVADKDIIGFAETIEKPAERIDRVATEAWKSRNDVASALKPVQSDAELIENLFQEFNRGFSLSGGKTLWWKLASEKERYLLLNAVLVKSTILKLTGQPFGSQTMDLVGRLGSEISTLKEAIAEVLKLRGHLRGDAAFLLYDTYGFPLDLTELMARERGLTVDNGSFEKLMEKQRARARAAQKKEVISLSQIETTTPTKFVGFDKLETDAKVVEVVSLKEKTAVILDTSVCYAEMGGQVGDTGEILVAADVRRRTPDATAESASSPRRLQITNTQKSGNAWLHFVEGENLPAIGEEVVLRVEAPRRNAIQRHHTVTHLLHWALHEVVSKEASQKGSFVGPDKLTFDFNSAPLTPAQVADIEKLVNERIVENAGVTWTEVPYADVKSRKDVMQFFGDKYGDTVRVVQIGGTANKLDGYSMELCGGTHTRATGEIGLFRIVGENAIAAGVRRIEAIAGLEAYRKATDELQLIKTLAGKVNSPEHELEKKIESLLAHQKKLEKEVKTAMQRNASNAASELLGSAQTVNGIPLITHNLGDADGDFLQAIADSLKGRFKGVVVLGGCGNNAVSLVATVSPEFTKQFQAGKIIQAIAPIVGGKGGGKPDNARGGGKDAGKLDEALAKARSLLA
jgi:alanyl-tRNA synthetase